MNRPARESVEVIKALLAPHGIPCRVDHGGKHVVVHVDHAGGHHKFTISTSPLNADHQKNNVRQQTVQWLERQGLAVPRGAASAKVKRRKKTRVRSIIHSYEVGGSRISEDPWAALAALQKGTAYEP